MNTVQIERHGRVAVLRMAKARANALDPDLLRGLIAACRQVRDDDAVGGVMLASAHPRIFSPGLDLVTLSSFERDELRGFMMLFAETIWSLFGLYEKPVLAALAGHAVAGGAVLALTADHRVLAAEGARMGLNELKVGVPLPWSVVLLLRAVLPPQALTRVMLMGVNLEGREALQTGLAHELAPSAGFEETCIQRLEELADRDPEAFAVTKRYLRMDTLDRMRAEETQRLPDFLDCWFSPASQERIQAQVAALTKEKRTS